MAEDLNKLKRKRTVIRSLTTKLISKLEECLLETETPVGTLEEYSEHLLEKASSLKQLDNEVENLLKDEEIETEITVSQEYQEKIITSKCRISKRIKELSNRISISSNSVTSEIGVSENTNESKTVKLPRLTITKFYGDPSAWLEFWNQFENAIHDNRSLSKIDKFNYLKSLLGGTAANAINGFSLTNDNYDAAVNLLKERFGRKDMLINAHMGHLLNIPALRNSNDISALRKLYDKCEIQIRSLESLGVTSETYGSLLCPILLKLIPHDLALEFSRSRDSVVNWNLDELMNFLRKELESRERANAINNTETKIFLSGNDRFRERYKQASLFKNKSRPINPSIPSAAELVTSVKENNCLFCESRNHDSELCEELSVDKKWKILKGQGRCFLCLQSRHRVRDCHKKDLCIYCNLKHNRTLCYQNQNNKTKPERVRNDTTVSTASQFVENRNNEVYLQTAAAELIGEQFNRTVRCLFDNGSQRTFITRDIVLELALTVVGKETLMIHTFQSKTPTQQVCRRVKVRIKSVFDSSELEIEALETNEVSNAVLGIPEARICDELNSKGFVLADIQIESSINNRKLSLLIGSDNYWKMTTGRIERLGTSLVAIETALGWCIQGQCDDPSSENKIAMNFSVDENAISHQLRQFWELENLGLESVEDCADISDQEVIKSFESTIKYENNRYSVKLPWKPNMKDLLENNKKIADKRHEKLVVRFRNNTLLFRQYKEVMNDYLNDGIIEPIPTQGDNHNPPIFYLPHHAVIRDDKTTSKLRVVYDASSHGEGKLSLNDCLYTGPNLNPDLLELLIRFRENPIAFTADIKQAFLQIELDEEDRDVARFLWTDDPHNQEESEYPEILRFTRVLFGVKSSPFLLAATIKYHLKKYKEQYSETYQLLNESLYVDDLIGGQIDIERALNASLESIAIFKWAGMHLRKWQTNSKDLRDRWKKLGIHLQDSSAVIAQTAIPFKVLGIAWNTENDNFYYDTTKLMEFLSKQGDSKRFILQVAGRVFDPVGFLGPFIIKIKCLIQEIWSTGIGWDDKLPERLNTKWREWCDEISELNKLIIPRYYLEAVKEEKSDLVELHCFSDASKRAYGSVLYLRVITESGRIHTCFVSSKSRVAPLKTVSLPRLELMGALLSARLGSRIAKCLRFINVSRYFWTDSTITYYWIRGTPSRFKPFVKNRVEEIQSLTQPSDWSHCPGKDNPADLLSRGMSASDLKSSKLWWHGPSWLKQPAEFWPTKEEHAIEEGNLEIKSKFRDTFQYDCILTKEEKLIDINKYSNLIKVLRITAWIKRFVSNSKSSIREKGPLSAEELQEAEDIWIKSAQNGSYNSEIQALATNRNVDKQSIIHNLSPYLDGKGILRIGGRLNNSEFDINESHPTILPRNDKFTELLIVKEHNKLMHSGVAATLSQLRLRFWIPKGRQYVKKIIGKCLICQKYSAKPANQMTGQLPKDRIHESPPFYISGIDFAGPVYVKDKTTSQKAYIVLFTCAVTRAVHLELVTNLTTDNFLLAFRRFIARRGTCQTIYSDNAKTFKCAEKQLTGIVKLLRSQKIYDYIAKEGISWKYIMERAAWWGGFYERMIKAVKTCLRKVLGRAMLNLEEMMTLLAEVEAVLNARPMTYNYSDCHEPEALTPAHFLAGRNSILDPPLNYKSLLESSTTDGLCKRKRYRQLLLKQVWTKWKTQYLLDLRTAHHLSVAQMMKATKVGDVVLIEGNTKSKLLWELGVVCEVFHGRDNQVRSCAVRTVKGLTIRRPIQLLYPLEIETNNISTAEHLPGSEDVEK